MTPDHHALPASSSQPSGDATPHLETEIKLRPDSLDQVLATAEDLGFVLHTARSFESNTLFDTQNSTLRAAGQILRLREYAGQTVLTFKGAAVSGRHKVREELETAVGNGSQLRLVLERLGYRATFRYEKFRTVYERPGESGLLTVDETPIGPFLELEGSPAWIDRVATGLGFSPQTYITDSYGQLWMKHCAGHGIPLGDFVFVTEGDSSR